MPDFQDYHALRGVRDAKVLRHGLPDDPHDAIPAVDHERDPVTGLTGDLPVDEEILQFPNARCAERSETIPWPPAPNGPRPRQLHHGFYGYEGDGLSAGEALQRAQDHPGTERRGCISETSSVETDVVVYL